MDAELKAFLQRADALMARLEPLLPAQRAPMDWAVSLAARWHREGQGGYLQPLNVSLDMRLTDLIGIDRQTELLARNTHQFVSGLPANHVLLWGARGTGKSSLIRALLAEHAPEAGEGDYRVLKSVLDGSLERAPENVLLYATSNRRHLVPERQSDNENWQMVDGELHPNEAVEDKIALSDRFGLWLSFYPFSQEHYLNVVRHWVESLARQAGLQWAWDDELEKDAIRWATARGNRNGRCAYQFARQWVGMRLL